MCCSVRLSCVCCRDGTIYWYITILWWYIKTVIQYWYKFKSHRYIEYPDISMYQYQYIQYCIHIYTVFIGWYALLWINYCTLQLSGLQLNNFREQKKVTFVCQNLLIDTILYRAIYCCIMILRRQYIDTHKSCIVPSLEYYIFFFVM